MPALIQRLEQNLRSRPAELLQDLRLLRQVRRSALDFETSPELSRGLQNVEAAMRLLRDHLRRTLGVAAGGRPSAEQIRNARCCAELSRDLGENFYLHDDLVTWTRLLGAAEPEVLRQEEGAAQALALLQGWSALRDAAQARAENSSGAPLPMNDSQITERMREVRDLLISRLGLHGPAGEATRALLSHWIDSNQSRSLAELTVDGLNRYAAGAATLQAQIARAQAENDPAARRALLLQAFGSAVNLNSPPDLSRIRSLLEAALPAEGSPNRESVRLETLIAAHEAVRGRDLGIEANLRRDIEALCGQIGARERALLSPEELRGRSLPPGHSAGGTTEELVQRARALTLARSFYLTIGRNDQAGFLFLSLRRVRNELRASIQGASSRMDASTYAESCRTLAEVSILIADARSVEVRLRTEEIYQGMLGEARARGQDVSWSSQQREIRERASQAAQREYSEGLRRDLDRYLVAIGRLRRSEPAVALERRLEHCRAASMLVRALRTQRGTEEPLIAQAALDSRTQIIGQLWTAFFEDSLEQSGEASPAQRALAQDIVYDLRTRVHFAMADNARAEDLAWLSGLSSEGVLEFAQTSQAAHLLTLDRRQDPPTPAELQACLQAAQLFASLGLNNRVREVTRPLSSYAYGLQETDPAQAAQRASLLLVLAQIYSQTGAMETELNAALQGVVALDRPGELHQSAQLARAMIAMQAGNLLEARDFLLTIPDHPMAQTFLQGLRDGQRAQRIAQIVGVLRAVSLNYIERGRASGENMDAVERDTLGGWQEVQRLMLSGEAQNVDEALQRIGRSRRFPHFTTGTGEYHIGSNVGYFMSVVSNPSLSDADFHRAIFELCGFLRMDDYFQAASQIYQMMEGDPRTRDHAHARLEAIPAEARFHAGLNVARTLIALRAGPAGLIAVSSTSGASPDEMLQNAAMVVLPFAAARAVAVGAEGLFVARATGGSIRLIRGTGLVVQAGSRTVEGLNYLRFGVRSGTEAAVFTASSMAMHTVFTGRTDHWTWGNFGREFGSMLLTFGLCHGIGYGVRSLGRAASRLEVLRAPGRSAELGSEALRPAAQWALGRVAYGSTIAGLTGLEYLNEALGLHPHEGEVPLALRVMSSALMDAQMRAASRGIDAVSGGRISVFERSTQGAQTYHDLLPALDRLGLPRPDAEGRLQARVAQGEDPAAIVASLNPSPRTLRVARTGGAWSEWLRSHALGMAFLFTGVSGGSFRRLPRSTVPVPEERWWESQEQRNRLEDQFADADFADVHWPSAESPALRLGLPGSRVPEDQLAGLASVLAAAPEGSQPTVRIELAGLSDPANLSSLLPLLRRGFAFEVQVAGRDSAIGLRMGSDNQLRAQGMDAALFRVLGPRLRENFTQLVVEGVADETEALGLARTAAEIEGPELVVMDGEGRESIRYGTRGFSVPGDGSRSDYANFLRQVVELAGRRPVRLTFDGRPLMAISRGPQGINLNLELSRANPTQVLAALRRLGEAAEGPFRGAEIQINNLDPAVYRRSEVRAGLAALTRSALASAARRLTLRLRDSGGEGPLILRLSPSSDRRTSFRFESALPVEEIPEVLSEYLAFESAEIFRLGRPTTAQPSAQELSVLWRAALSRAQAYSQRGQAGVEYRPYWSEAGSVQPWLAGISALGSYARFRGNAESVQQALRNILQYSEPPESTVLSSNGFAGWALGDNGFELLRLARDLGRIHQTLGTLNELMGRHGNVEIGGALVGMIYRSEVLGEGGARSELNVLREQRQTALTAAPRRHRFILLPRDQNCRVTTPEWIVEGLDETGRPNGMTTVEVKSRNTQSSDFNEYSLRDTLQEGTAQLTTHGFSNGTAEARATLALRFTGVTRSSSLQADVARLLAERYQELSRSSEPASRTAAERMRRMDVELYMQGPGNFSQRVTLHFEAGRWREPTGPFRQAG